MSAALSVKVSAAALALAPYGDWKARVRSRQSPIGKNTLYVGDTKVTLRLRDDLGEVLLGRDVMNEFAVTVCAKRDQVEFEWVEDAPP